MSLAQIFADIQKRRAELQKELSRLDAAANALQGLRAGGSLRATRHGRRLSAAARKRISDAQKARWAKSKKQKRTS